VGVFSEHGVHSPIILCLIKAPMSSYFTPILRSLNWLKINEHTE